MVAMSFEYWFGPGGARAAAWCNTSAHRRAQALGRSRFFAGCRLRMAEAICDFGPDDREQAPADSRRARMREALVFDLAIELDDHHDALAVMCQALGRAGISIASGGMVTVPIAQPHRPAPASADAGR